MFRGMEDWRPPGLAKAAPGPQHAAGVNGSYLTPQASSGALAYQIEAAITSHLASKPDGKEYCPKLGIYLRGRNLIPTEGLKRFVMSRPEKFIFHDEQNGTQRVQLRSHAGSGATSHVPPSPVTHDMHAQHSQGQPGLPPGVDESYLERELVGFISKRTKRTGEPTNMPSLGEFCIRSLGFSMKGLLTRFLSLRPHLFTLPDDGRQHVLLAPGAVQAVGLSDGDSEGLPALPDDILGMSTTPRAPSSTAFDPDYHKWDQITQKIYDFLRSRGGIAQFRDVEAHMRERWPQLLSSQGYSPSVWKAPVFTYKRRNIFRKDGHMVAIIQRGGNNAAPATASHDGWDVPSAVAPSEDPFPPLSAGGAGGATGALPRSQAQSFARAQGVAPPLMDLAAERKALEALRDDIVARLDALQPLAELQEQNSSLRAACITLGRELLTVKEDMAAMKAQLQASGMLPAARPGVDVAPTISLGTGFGNLHLGDSARGYNVFHPSQGDIFLIGGHDGVTWLDTIDRFSTPSGSLASLAAMPAPRSFCSAVATPEGVIVVGGGNGELWYESAVCLQPGSTGWKALGGLKVARGNLATAATGGRVYAFGGGKPGEQYNLVEWYDAQSNSWNAAPELGVRRFALSGASMDGALYAVGGYDGQAYLASVERMDPREGRWTPVTSMLGERGGHACAALGHELYAFGGYSKGALDTCEVYDSRANAWRPMPRMAESRAYGAAVAVGGEVFMVGGLLSDMQTHAPLLASYSPGTGAWRHLEVPSQANPRRSFLGACAWA